MCPYDFSLPLPSQASQRHLPFVAVPRVLHDYTARRVLTMEWIEGDRPVDLLAAADARSSSEGSSEARTKLLSLVSGRYLLACFTHCLPPNLEEGTAGYDCRDDLSQT